MAGGVTGVDELGVEDDVRALSSFSTDNASEAETPPRAAVDDDA